MVGMVPHVLETSGDGERLAMAGFSPYTMKMPLGVALRCMTTRESSVVSSGDGEGKAETMAAMDKVIQRSFVENLVMRVATMRRTVTSTGIYRWDG